MYLLNQLEKIYTSKPQEKKLNHMIENYLRKTLNKNYRFVNK